MIKIKYTNGSYSRANKVSPIDFGQGRNTVIIASNEGWLPFRGKPEDMARDAIGHINEALGYEIGYFPVFSECFQGIDDLGFITSKVVFQAV